MAVPLDEELTFYLTEIDGRHALLHPLIYALDYTEERNHYLNQTYRDKVKALAQCHRERDFEKYVWLHERPWRLDAFSEISENLNSEEYWRLLGLVWADTESVSADCDLWRELFAGSRTEARRAIMDDHERAVFDSLPADLTVYRGCSERSKQGLSWTLDLDRAVFFARRHEEPSLVLKGKCRKETVIAFMDGRKEKEIIVFPEDVSGASELPRPWGGTSES